MIYSLGGFHSQGMQLNCCFNDLRPRSIQKRSHCCQSSCWTSVKSTATYKSIPYTQILAP